MWIGVVRHGVKWSGMEPGSGAQCGADRDGAVRDGSVWAGAVRCGTVRRSRAVRRGAARRSHALLPPQTLMLPQCADGAALPPPPSPLHPPPPAAAAPSGMWGERPEPREEGAAVDAMLRDVSEKCRAALRSLGASPGGSSPTAKRPRQAPRLHGAFRGMRTVCTVPSGGGGLEGGGSLRAALGEAGSIRTLAFPQGSAFTLRTAAGGYRFRWVPR